MKQNRNCYLIDKALRHFLIASVLTSAATQLAVMVDAIIVSHIVGPDALSAVNVSSPVITIVVALSLLLGSGASVLAAKYIGNQQMQSVSHVFTVAICSVTVVSLVLTVILGFSTDWIVSLICSNEQIAPYVSSYLSFFLVAGPVPLFLSYTLNAFVQSDGKPHLVTYAVIAGGVTNVVLDLLLVGPMGIKGAAIATVSNYVVSIGFVLFHFMSPSSSYHWRWPKGIVGKVLGENVAEGMPMMIGNLMLGVIVMVINILVMNALGAEGMYAWSVCLQVLLLSVVLLNGVGNALLSIGGMLVGEQDYSGLGLLTRRALGIVCAILLLFVVFVMVTPSTLAKLFGADTLCADNAHALTVPNTGVSHAEHPAGCGTAADNGVCGVDVLHLVAAAAVVGFPAVGIPADYCTAGNDVYHPSESQGGIAADADTCRRIRTLDGLIVQLQDAGSGDSDGCRQTVPGRQQAGQFATDVCPHLL